MALLVQQDNEALRFSHSHPKLAVHSLKMVQIHYFVAIQVRLQPAVRRGGESVCGKGEVQGAEGVT